MLLLEQFLKDSSLDQDARKVEENRFRYTYDLGVIDFVSLNVSDPKKFLEIHTDTWCENKTEFFVAVFEDGTFRICDSRTRPESTRPIENASIVTFKYGDNSDIARRYMDLFKKENIDTGQCLKEIRKLLVQRRPRITVDSDLLENLEGRINAIVQLVGERNNAKEIAQKIVDRCLFIRFLEDRAGRNNLKRMLSDHSKKMEDLIRLFDFYSDSLNGDVFEKEDIPKDLDIRIMRELEYIFGEVYTYMPVLQKTLVPYSFKKIPIILISNIYEKFLAEEGGRKSEGIVFTPENVVEYTINKMLEPNRITMLLENDSVSILDPACGSGVFLVKFFERIVEIKERQGKKLSLEEKAGIVKNCLYGIDKNNDALRIAALSLYLKIIEDETPEIINKRLFGEGEEHFMFPGLKKNGNLVRGNSLFDSIFDRKQFDIIAGNPPWGYDFLEREKRSIKRNWPSVSKYQSSQCFLLNIKKWTKRETICGMVVNLSNFTNSASKRFRAVFIQTYFLKTFANLSRVKSITFGGQSEPACIIIFDRMPCDEIEFISPELSQFSKLTKIISDDNVSRFSVDELRKNDNLWHIYSLGYDMYIDLINFLSRKTLLNHFKQRFEVGIMKYRSASGLTEEEFNKKYRSTIKAGEDYFPIVDSLKNVQPYFGKEKKDYFRYGPHLDRARDLSLFKDEKLIITRSWPIIAFIDSDTTLYDGRFFVFKLRRDFPREYLLLFEAVLNSKVAQFYLGVNYLLRKEGNYSKVNLDNLKQFPIPDLKNKNEIIKIIIEKVKSIHNGMSYTEKSRKDVDDLIFKLYDLDYYAVQQIEHYYELEETKEEIVTSAEIKMYCEEFTEAFRPFLREDLFLNAASGISDFFGTMVEFTISDTKTQFNSDSAELKGFIPIIEKNQAEEYDRKRIFKEERIKFYDNEKLYIYKSNKPKDWTKFMAIKDANEEVGLFLQKLGSI